MEAKKLEKELTLYETWKEQCRYRNPFDFFGVLFGRVQHPIYSRTDLTPQEKDEIMLAYDWRQVGKSLRSAMN
jgi:hypothetical protein